MATSTVLENFPAAVNSLFRQGLASMLEGLAPRLRAAAHPTRLQILQLLAGHPRSTRELAGLIGLTEAAISKHLKPLAEAGWVEPERHSYYVYYRLVRGTHGTHGRLADALKELFD
ncbi:ArsR/SmtB family transcription factor [Streptosporangium sp. NPDC000396]|uniref:ArsR/SmtB family transcription factor n=1 Tax=Streptosporangium sp. NPDC000396 TaxID=3366185 RepID=UPI0036A8A4B5